MFTFLPTFIPTIVQIFPFVLAFVLLAAKPLHKHPVAFYIPIAIVVLIVSIPAFISGMMGDACPEAITQLARTLHHLDRSFPVLYPFVQLFTSIYTGISMYLIVMFIGALRKTASVRRLYSVRSELSILAGIIVAGHVLRVIDHAFFLFNPEWAERMQGPALIVIGGTLTFVGLALLVFFLIPWITSFPALRKRMSAATWKKTQLLAYPFMFFMVLMGMGLNAGYALRSYPYTSEKFTQTMASDPIGFLSSFAGDVASATVFFVVGVLYLGLRLNKHREDKEARLKAAKTAK